MSYNKKSYYKSQSRGSGQKGSSQKTDNIKFFKEKMSVKKYWSEYQISEFSPKDGDAYKIAEAFNKESRTSNQNKSSQLRKFYDEALKAKIKLQSLKEEEKEEALAIMLMIVPRAYYSYSRGLITDAVIDFLSTALDKNKFRTEKIEYLKKDYDRFLKFFESVIGFNYFLRGD